MKKMAAGLAVINAVIFDGKKFTRGNCVTVENGIIRAVTALKRGKKPAGSSVIIDAGGKILCPGFIDMHTHGADGIDSMRVMTGKDIMKISAAYAKCGVTSALLACFYKKGKSRLDEAVASCGGKFDGARILGTYMEGPFINMEKRGMIGKKFIFPAGGHPEKFLGKVMSERKTLRAMTVAPEMDRGFRIIKYLKKHSVIAAVGHTNSGYETTLEAIAAGALHVTHVFNAMRGFHHREPGPFMAAVEKGLTAEIICDGAHLHPAALKLVVKVIGAENLAIITDSTAMLGYPDGKYNSVVCGKIIIKGGAAYNNDGVLLGSCTPMNAMMRNMKKWGAASFVEILRMASYNPARILGLKDAGRIKTGSRADFALIDDEFNIYQTIVSGVPVEI